MLHWEKGERVEGFPCPIQFVIAGPEPGDPSSTKISLRRAMDARVPSPPSFAGPRVDSAAAALAKAASPGPTSVSASCFKHTFAFSRRGKFSKLFATYRNQTDGNQRVRRRLASGNRTRTNCRDIFSRCWGLR